MRTVASTSSNSLHKSGEAGLGCLLLVLVNFIFFMSRCILMNEYEHGIPVFNFSVHVVYANITVTTLSVLERIVL